MNLKLDDSTKVKAEYRNDHDNQIDNPSENMTFSDILHSKTKRRNVLKGGLATAVGGFFAGMAMPQTALAGSKNKGKRELIGFTPVSVADGNGATPTISEDYQYEVLIPWGEPLEPGGPEYSYPPSADDQAKQIGIGHDGMHFFGEEQQRGNSGKYRTPSSDKGMLAINHEFGRNTTVLAKSLPESLDDVRVSQHAHGVSIVAIEKTRRSGRWQTVASKDARRIHANTPVTFSGPVADSDLLKTKNGNIPLGTVNNCASGYTPWDTYLTCEENFNGYFGATNLEETWIETEAQSRYGFSATSGYGWHLFDKRFDLSDSDYHNEENRFGWVVEIDPFDATQTPVKRTALGRFKHEGVEITVGKDNRVVAYMGDDQRFDYIYKFVSDRNWQQMGREGVSPLDEGKLYVAKFNDDGTGDWLELTIDNPTLAASFTSQEEVLTFARLAADALGATPMDRPEWISVAPNSDVYCTLTNNSERTVADAANPLAPNNDGHIIRWRDTEHHTGEQFVWDVFLIAEETHGTEESFSDPDGLWIDPDGRVFIQTDGSQQDGLNNQMLVTDQGATEVKRLFTGVTSDEITGITVTPDRRTMFINTQHPGNGDPLLTNFPAEQDGVTIPRDCTIVITRKDGGIIGS
ncbi:MAG: PhoX family phosphatase [Acidiferrobacterales bacterium]|nr:PhoX family phosphatase [Acidiferrobacterales bacterium]